MIDDDLDFVDDYDFGFEMDDSVPHFMGFNDPGWASIKSIAPIEDYIGDPDGSGFEGQNTDFTCAVVSQQMILNEFGVVSPGTGRPLSEAELVYVATSQGWLYNGTSPEDVGKLLEYYGVGNHHGYGIDNLVEELRQGHKVIVGVDSSELWNAENSLYNDLKDYLVGERADHAIVVKGIIFDGQSEPTVVVNDPGRPDGAGNEYPLSVFMDAFEDGNCHYVATDKHPEELASHKLFGDHFDIETASYENPEVWAPYTLSKTDQATTEKIFLESAILASLTSLNEKEKMHLMMDL